MLKKGGMDPRLRGWHAGGLVLCALASLGAGDSPPQATPDASPAPAISAPPFSLSELSPYFEHGAMAEARAALDRGRASVALELLDRARRDGTTAFGDPARYLRAVALGQFGREQESAQEFLALAGSYPTLADHCRYAAGQALEHAGSFVAAADAFGDVAAFSRLRREAQFGRARMLRSAGQRSEAQAVLAPLLDLPAPASGLGRDLGAESLWLLAEIDEENGNASAAAQHYLAVWLRHPLAAPAETARHQAVLLMARLKPEEARSLKPGSEALLGRGELLLDANHNATALDQIRMISNQLPLSGEVTGDGGESQPSPLACRARFDLGKALRKLRKHDAAILALRAVADGCRLPSLGDLRPRALYLLAASAGVVDPEVAQRAYRELIRDYPDHSFADDALFLSAEIDRRAGRAAEAEQGLRQVVERYPHGDYAAEALFELFWIARSRGKPEEGLGALRQIEQRGAAAKDGSPADEPWLRARYWEAHVLEGTKDRRERGDAQAKLSELARSHPTSYYGALALGQVPVKVFQDNPPDPPLGNDASLQPGSLAGDSSFQAGVELLRLGFPEQAAEDLNAVDRARIEGPTGRLEPLLLLSICLDRAGDRRAAHAIAKASLAAAERRDGEEASGRSAELVAWFRRIAFPTAYRPEIERWARSYKVPPDLMQALMREESALDPQVISGAGAVGLTQLMPDTAARLARKLGLPRPSAVALEDPSLNIRLGTSYVADLLKRYHGNQAMAVAAYNAGEGTVDRWRAERGKEPLDAFVEEIPVTETRGYVKRVLGSYATYRFLYAKGPERITRF
jgi:soluble lytic murein transglycosylase